MKMSDDQFGVLAGVICLGAGTAYLITMLSAGFFGDLGLLYIIMAIFAAIAIALSTWASIRLPNGRWLWAASLAGPMVLFSAIALVEQLAEGDYRQVGIVLLIDAAALLPALSGILITRSLNRRRGRDTTHPGLSR